MRRSKEDTLETRMNILEAAIDCFSGGRYDIVPIETIADACKVTRGAVYWHFKDKMELYRAVVDYALERGDIAGYFNGLSKDIDIEDRFTSVFWYVLGENRYADFVFNTLTFTYGREEFKEIYDKLVKRKKLLYDSFRTAIAAAAEERKSECDPEYEAKKVYLMFEGLLLTKNIPVGLKLKKYEIDEIIKSAFVL